MKVHDSIIAKTLAIMSVLMLTFLPMSTADAAGLFSRMRSRRIQQTTSRPATSKPKPILKETPEPIIIPQDDNPLGPPAPGLSTSEPETYLKVQTISPEALSTIQKQIATALKTNNIIRTETKHNILNSASFISPTISLIPQSSQSRFNLLGRRPAVKAYEESTQAPTFRLIPRAAAVRALQEEVPKVETPIPLAPKIELPPAPQKIELLLNDNFDDIPEPGDAEIIIPELKIVGADNPIPLGELVQLWVQVPDTIPNNLQSTAYTWTVLPDKEFVVWPDKTGILFSSGIENTTFIVIVTASHVFADKDNNSSFTNLNQQAITRMITVKIGDGISGNNPNPKIPTGLTGLQKQAHDWVINVNITNSYTVDMKNSDALKLSASFKQIAGKIQDGTLSDITAILQATKESNATAISTEVQWLPWFSQMSEHLQTSFNNGNIKTLQQFTIAWLDISKGLEKAAN